MTEALRDSLECDHCGDVAVWADKEGMFHDNSDWVGGDRCLSCGIAGHISFDDQSEDEPVYWLSSDDPKDRCNQKNCDACGDEP